MVDRLMIRVLPWKAKARANKKKIKVAILAPGYVAMVLLFCLGILGGYVSTWFRAGLKAGEEKALDHIEAAGSYFEDAPTAPTITKAQVAAQAVQDAIAAGIRDAEARGAAQHEKALSSVRLRGDAQRDKALSSVPLRGDEQREKALSSVPH